MKVLHICPYYFNRPLFDKLFLSLESLNVVNEVFAHSDERVTKLTDKPYKLTYFSRKFGILNRLAYFPKQKIILKVILNKIDLSAVNIIHAHTLFSSGYSAYKIHKQTGLPYIVAIRATDTDLFLKWMLHLRGLGRTILQNAQTIVFLSPSYRDLVVTRYVQKKNQESILKKSIVIPNGIDNYFLLNKFKSRKSIYSNLAKLIYIGEIAERKNIKTTIKACKLIRNRGYKVVFTIVGKMMDRKYIEVINNHEFIRYFPHCSKEEVLRLLRDSDILVMPSKVETFGLVYAEAMSQGLPVIYSKGQGFDGQFIDGEVGFAVNCFDHEEIAEKITAIYSNYAEISERCVNHVDKFNWSVIAEKYKSVYQSSIRY